MDLVELVHILDIYSLDKIHEGNVYLLNKL